MSTEQINTCEHTTYLDDIEKLYQNAKRVTHTIFEINSSVVIHQRNSITKNLQ